MASGTHLDAIEASVPSGLRQATGIDRVVELRDSGGGHEGGQGGVGHTRHVLVGERAGGVAPSLVVVADAYGHRAGGVLGRRADERAGAVEDGHHVDVVEANTQRGVVHKVGADDSDAGASAGRAREGHHFDDDGGDGSRGRWLQLGRVGQDAHGVRLDGGDRLELVASVAAELKLDAEESLALLMRCGGDLEFLECYDLAVGDLHRLGASHEARLLFERVAAHENGHEIEVRVVVNAVVDDADRGVRLQIALVDVTLRGLLHDHELSEARRLGGPTTRASLLHAVDPIEGAGHERLAHLEHVVDSETKQLKELHRLHGVHLREELMQPD